MVVIRPIAPMKRIAKPGKVVSRVFRTFDLPFISGRLLGWGCFGSGPHGGQSQSRSGDGHNFGQPIHLQVPFAAPLGCRHMP